MKILKKLEKEIIRLCVKKWGRILGMYVALGELASLSLPEIHAKVKSYSFDLRNINEY